jgi:hypothetical protein
MKLKHLRSLSERHPQIAGAFWRETFIEAPATGNGWRASDGGMPLPLLEETALPCGLPPERSATRHALPRIATGTQPSACVPTIPAAMRLCGLQERARELVLAEVRFTPSGTRKLSGCFRPKSD